MHRVIICRKRGDLLSKIKNSFVIPDSRRELIPPNNEKKKKKEKNSNKEEGKEKYSRRVIGSMDNLIRLPRLTFHSPSWELIKIRSRNGLTKKKAKKYPLTSRLTNHTSYREDGTKEKNGKVHFKIKIHDNVQESSLAWQS